MVHNSHVEREAYNEGKRGIGIEGDSRLISIGLFMFSTPGLALRSMNVSKNEKAVLNSRSSRPLILPKLHVYQKTHPA